MTAQDAIARMIGAYNGQREMAIRSTKLRFVVVLAILAIVVFVAMIASATNEDVYGILSYRGRRSGLPIFISGPLVILLIGWLWSRAVIDKVRLTLRSELFPVIFRHIEGFSFTNGKEAVALRKAPSKAFGYHDSKVFDDCIAGTYRGVPVEITEVRVTRRVLWRRGAKTVFEGVCLVFPLASAPVSQIVARPHKITRPIREKVLLLSRFVSIRSGVLDVDSQYDIFSTTPRESTSFISERIVPVLRWLLEAWPHGIASLSVADGHAFLLMPIKHDLFDLPEIHTPVSYAEHVAPIIGDVDVLMRTAYAVRRMLEQGADQRPIGRTLAA